MFDKKNGSVFGNEALIFDGLGNYSLADTMECGQCFRAVRLPEREGEACVEYLTVVGEMLITVGQRSCDELYFYGTFDASEEEALIRYFSIDEDYDRIREDIISRTDSEFLITAANVASGIRILRQEPWEALFSFIVSQNNNIPRIKRIIRLICAGYGVNLAERSGAAKCPLALERQNMSGKLDPAVCAECGACYKFPSAKDVDSRPELLLPSHPGFRFKYLTDAASRVASGEIDLDKIQSARDYSFTMSELQKIKGVGEKVASCTALFAFSNLNAFPIDVWMKRAIDEYFGGSLDHEALGEYAGVAQQYIFHYIRTISAAK